MPEFKIHRVINGKRLTYAHSFLRLEEAKGYAEKEFKSMGLAAEVIKSGNINFLFDIYAEIINDKRLNFNDEINSTKNATGNRQKTKQTERRIKKA